MGKRRRAVTSEASSTKPLTRKQAERAWLGYKALLALQGRPTEQKLTEPGRRGWRRCVVCGWPTEFNYACEPSGFSGRSCWQELTEVEQQRFVQIWKGDVPMWYVYE